MSLTKSEFERYAAEGYNRLPLMREVLADLDTPLSAYLKLTRDQRGGQRYSYLFESVQGGEKWGRYSMIGLPCRTVLRVKGNEISVERDGEVTDTQTSDDPLEFIEQFAQKTCQKETANEDQQGSDDVRNNGIDIF